MFWTLAKDTKTTLFAPIKNINNYLKNNNFLLDIYIYIYGKIIVDFREEAALMKKYQVVINNGKGWEKILTTTNKAEAELICDGYKHTHIVAMLESVIDF